MKIRYEGGISDWKVPGVAVDDKVVFELETDDIDVIVGRFACFLVAIGYHPDTVNQYLIQDHVFSTDKG